MLLTAPPRPPRNVTRAGHFSDQDDDQFHGIDEEDEDDEDDFEDEDEDEDDDDEDDDDEDDFDVYK
jgi:hypothetical protein